VVADADDACTKELTRSEANGRQSFAKLAGVSSFYNNVAILQVLAFESRDRRSYKLPMQTKLGSITVHTFPLPAKGFDPLTASVKDLY
jgi:hypothetical protein